MEPFFLGVFDEPGWQHIMARFQASIATVKCGSDALKVVRS
jgi:hypothetical protein